MKNLGVYKILKSEKFKILVIVLVSFSLVYYLFGENLHAKWWYLDDHEIMMYLGSDRELSLGEIPSILINKTEVGDFGEYERFRPSYYTLRLLETTVIGDNPSLWYLSRILMVTSFLSIVWYLSSKHIGFIKGFLITIITLCAGYWVEILGRLGPGETYAVFGTGLFLLGLSNLAMYVNDPDPIKKGTLYLSEFILTLGAIIAIGSKENFVILLVPTGFLFLYALLKKKTNIGLIISTAVIFLYGAFVSSSIFIALSNTEANIYGESIRLREILDITYHRIPGILKELKILLITICVSASTIGVYLLKGWENTKKYLKKISTFYFCMFCLISLYLSQVFFYKGAWPTNMRYDFPGLLYVPFYFLILILLIEWTFKALDFKEVKQEQAIFIMFIGVFIVLSPLQLSQTFKDYSHQNVARTKAYTDTIESIVYIAKQDLNRSIFIESYSVWDYELIVSVNRFLRANGIKNNIYININGYSSEGFQDPFQKKLAGEIEDASLGGDIIGESFITRSGSIKKEPGCITLNMLGVTEDICNSFIIR